MYAFVPGLPYKTFQWDETHTDFLDPDNRHHPMTVSFARGGPNYADSIGDRHGYIWKLYVSSNNDVILEREDNPNPMVLFNKEDIEQIDFDFDQNMRPFVVFVRNGLPYYYYYNSFTSVFEEAALPVDRKFPRVCMDYTEQDKGNISDIIMGYMKGDSLCFSIQRERFRIEHVIATDPKKSMLWRIGRLNDTRFAYQWR